MTMKLGIFMKKAFVYILFNRPNGTLYTGVTGDLIKRTYEHKTKLKNKGFTAKYNIDKLGYFEVFEDFINAIAREKQIKAGSRSKKIALIKAHNPEWRDLYEDIV
jgi:putative endonuclease